MLYHTQNQCYSVYFSSETCKLVEHSFTHIYKYVEENPTGPKRKLKQTIEHMEEASSSSSTVSLHAVNEINYITM